MKCRTILYFFSIVACANISCQEGLNNPWFNEATANDTLIRDIPKWPNGEPNNTYKAVVQMANRFNIEKLTDGYDPIQIRIWYATSSFKDTGQLFLLKRNNENWNVQLFRYVYNQSKTDPRYTIIFKQLNAIPHSGWKSFIDDLYKLKIHELPDMDNIEGNNYTISEGEAYIVEFATKKRYRLYSYVSPYDFKEWWQTRNMTDILSLIENEFDFK